MPLSTSGMELASLRQEYCQRILSMADDRRSAVAAQALLSQNCLSIAVASSSIARVRMRTARARWNRAGSPMTTSSRPWRIISAMTSWQHSVGTPTTCGTRINGGQEAPKVDHSCSSWLKMDTCSMLRGLQKTKDALQTSSRCGSGATQPSPSWSKVFQTSSKPGGGVKPAVQKQRMPWPKLPGASPARRSCSQDCAMEPPPGGRGQTAASRGPLRPRP
mmetsp:Transcript_94584/g.294197  ORF Transcript_94584/g.294197 Transcript_94584/m.294197 type:complete len:219 (+) Transcript_94584:1237-1893(+)